MHKKTCHFRFFAALFTLLFLLCTCRTDAFADALSDSGSFEFAPVQDINSETGYRLVIDDQAGYFSEEQVTSLKSIMREITAYSNIAIVTTTDHPYGTEYYAGECFDDFFGPHADGSLFLIDRDEDEIFLYSDGAARKVITDSRAYSITDNTYIYATASRNYDYYTCCYKTMEQVLTLQSGHKIAEPMKYICSALLALIVSLLFNYLLARFLSRAQKPGIREILSGTYSNVRVNNANSHFLHQTKTYSPQSSGGGGGGHGGGGHGGGHSGGGGGHHI